MGAQQSTANIKVVPQQLCEKQRDAEEAAGHLEQRFKRLDLGNSVKASDSVTAEHVEAWSKSYASQPARQAIGTILSKQDLLANLTQRKAAIADTQVFNLKLSNEITPVTNQMSSGRCWLFASCNVARLAFAKKYNVDDFQFSQSYLFFCDKLEKANYYLENSIDLVEEPLDSRIVSYLSESPVNDGGQWDQVVNIIEKYGLVPKSLFPETWHSSNSGKLNSLLTSKLREFSLELRALFGKTVAVMDLTTAEGRAHAHRVAIAACRAKKTTQMAEVYTIMAMTLGEPPHADEKLNFEFYDKDKRFQSLSLTPLELYKSLGSAFDTKNCISLINDPRNTLDTLYTVQRLGNVWGARPVLYVNTSTNVMHDMIIKMLKKDMPIWFGCDVGKCCNSTLGIMDCDLFDYENTFGTNLGMTKAQRLQTGESSMTHAMVIVAAHVGKDGKIERVRIENSWSDERGTKGYFVATWKWMEEYAFQIVVPKNVAPSSLVDVFEAGNPVELPCWDPMGALA